MLFSRYHVKNYVAFVCFFIFVACYEDQCSGLLLGEFDAMLAAFNLSFNTSSFTFLPSSRYFAVYNQSRIAIVSIGLALSLKSFVEMHVDPS